MPSANIKNLFTPQGLLKIVQLVIGTICYGIIQYYSNLRDENGKDVGFVQVRSEGFYFILVTFTFSLITFLLLVAYIFEGEELRKMAFEILYQLVGAICFFTASITLLTLLGKFRKYGGSPAAVWVAGVIGLLNAVPYLLGALLVIRARRN